MTGKPELLLDDLIFAEGPRWRDGWLWFSDMHAGEVLRLGTSGRVERVASVPQRPSGLGFLPDGRLLIASMEDRKLLRLDDAALVEHADLDGYATGPINDMVVDSVGRAYVGQFGSDTYGGEPMRDTSLMLALPDGSSREVATGLTMPNGMAISPDGGTLILAESYARRLTRFAIADDGSLSDRRAFGQFDVRPDGICMDAQGCIWFGVPMYPGGAFLRVADGGEILERIELDGWRGIACALGGDDRRTLYLLEARRTSPVKIQGRGNARIRSLRVDVAGAGIP